VKNKIKNALSSYEKIVIWGTRGLAKTTIKNWLPLNKVIYCVDKHVSINTKNIGDINILPVKNLKENLPNFIT